MPADWLEMLGQHALGMFWLPLLAWTAVALAAMGLLRVWRSAHALVHYTARAALLLALPFMLHRRRRKCRSCGHAWRV